MRCPRQEMETGAAAYALAVKLHESCRMFPTTVVLVSDLAILDTAIIGARDTLDSLLGHVDHLSVGELWQKTRAMLSDVYGITVTYAAQLSVQIETVVLGVKSKSAACTSPMDALFELSSEMIRVLALFPTPPAKDRPEGAATDAQEAQVARRLLAMGVSALPVGSDNVIQDFIEEYSSDGTNRGEGGPTPTGDEARFPSSSRALTAVLSDIVVAIDTLSADWVSLVACRADRERPDGTICRGLSLLESYLLHLFLALGAISSTIGTRGRIDLVHLSEEVTGGGVVVRTAVGVGLFMRLCIMYRDLLAAWVLQRAAASHPREPGESPMEEHRGADCDRGLARGCPDGTWPGPRRFEQSSSPASAASRSTTSRGNQRRVEYERELWAQMAATGTEYTRGEGGIGDAIVRTALALRVRPGDIQLHARTRSAMDPNPEAVIRHARPEGTGCYGEVVGVATALRENPRISIGSGGGGGGGGTVGALTMDAVIIAISIVRAISLLEGRQTLDFERTYVMYPGQTTQIAMSDRGLRALQLSDTPAMLWCVGGWHIVFDGMVSRAGSFPVALLAFMGASLSMAHKGSPHAHLACALRRRVFGKMF